MIYLIKRTASRLGDAVMLEPLISTVKEQHPDDEIWVQVQDWIAPIFQNHPGINRVCSEGECIPELDAFRILDIATDGDCPWAKYAERFSPSITKSKPAIYAKVAGHKLAQFNAPRYEYDGRGARLYLSEEEEAFASQLRTYCPGIKVGIQVRPSESWREYPHMELLIKHILKKTRWHVFLYDHAETPDIEGAISVVGRGLREVMWHIRAMDVFVGPDSGLLQVSAALGTPTYGLFGATNPNVIMDGCGDHVSWSEKPRVCKRAYCWFTPCEKIWCLRLLSPRKIFKDIRKIAECRLLNADLKTKTKKKDFGFLISTQQSQISNPGSIALMRLDGLGGTLTLTDHAKKIHERTGDKVTLITRGYEVLFENNPHVEKVINIGMRDWKEASFVYRNNFETLAEIRFGIGRWYSQNGSFKQDFMETHGETDEGFTCVLHREFQRIFEQFPMNLKELEIHGLHHIQLTNKTLNLPYEDIEVEVFVDEKFEGVDDDFVLINNGVDVIYGAMRQTKCWEGWGAFVACLKGKQVVQVGTLDDPPVEGVIDLRGQTNLKQLIYLIRKANAVVVIEGGVMHIAEAVKNPNVIILAGPTNNLLFKYPGHTWVTSYVCGNCWSTTERWYEKCPKDCDAVCMKTIMPQRVADIYEDMAAS